MADDVLITPGSGARIAADELTIGGQSVKVQRIKTALGKDGEYIGDQGGALVDTDRGAAFVRERPNIREFVPTVTVNTAVYVSGDCLGGKITIPNAVAAAGDVLRIHRIFAVAKVASGGANMYLFNDDPSGTTFTDHSAFPAIATADLSKLRWSYSPSESDDGIHRFISIARTFGDDLPDIPLVGTSLYFAMSIAGTPDYVTSSDFKLAILAERL